MATSITCIFTDVGGVLATNGWDRTMREKAASQFGLNYEEVNERHHLTFDTYEEGKLSLDQYLERVIFYEPRNFHRDEFVRFMYEQSQPFQPVIDMLCSIKQRYGLEVGVVSNEGRELTMHRIDKFKLHEFVDFFIVSCFVHFRKPDADIWRMALDIAQVAPEQVVYLEDRPMFVDVANELGMHAIHHTSLETTKAALAAHGMVI